MTERVNCVDCAASILPSTYEKYGGFCAHCGTMSENLRQERRKYYADLASGAVFLPQEKEWRGARTHKELFCIERQWRLSAIEYEYFYDEVPFVSVTEAIEYAKEQKAGEVYLIDQFGAFCYFSFSQDYAVVDYQADYMYYAYSDSNLKQQVTKEQHIAFLDIHWYPSRCHMPRRQGFSLLGAIVDNEDFEDVRWLSIEDISYTEQGKG